jgi:hypothetical protein
MVYKRASGEAGLTSPKLNLRNLFAREQIALVAILEAECARGCDSSKTKARRGQLSFALRLRAGNGTREVIPRDRVQRG